MEEIALEVVQDEGMQRDEEDQSSELDIQERDDILAFTFKTLLAATEGFSDDKKLGTGGFGPVYKGLLPGGKEVAVKRLFDGSRQGLEELKNEIRILPKLQHQNIVKLHWYCTEGDEKLLVYEYLSGKSLDVILFDETRSVELTWDARREIILGIARGMLYPHQDSPLRVIHLDLKPSNILLDSKMNPKISDFGISQILEENQTQGQTFRLIGTRGYRAPEFAMFSTFSPKSDVYSYGVVVLEIISGRKTASFHDSEISGNYDIIDYVWSVWEKGEVTELLDKTVAKTCSDIDAFKYIKLALLCVQDDPKVGFS